MARKTERKPKLTDAQRHARFTAMVKEVGASDDPKDFDRAFTKVVQGKRVTRDQTQRPHSKPPISRDTRGRQ